MTGVAVKVTEPPTQIEIVVDVIDTAGITVVAVIGIALLVAVAGLAHGSLEVMITVTTSLLLSVVDVNVAAVSPGTLTLLTCHW